MRIARLVSAVCVGALSFLLATLPVESQDSNDIDEGTVHRAILPVAGDVPGWGGVRWKSIVRLVNASADALFVGITLIGSGFPSVAFSLESGQNLEMSDIVGATLGTPGAVGPLEINTLGSEPIRIQAFAVPYIEGRPGPWQPIPAIADEVPPGITVLPGLVVDRDFRTTLGICNLSTEPVTIVVALELIEGRILAWSRMTLAPESVSHAPIQNYFPLLLAADDVMVVVDSPAPGVLAYASVIDNRTHEARFVSPRIPLSANRENTHPFE